MTVLLVAPAAQGSEVARVLESSCIEVISYDDPMQAVGSLAVCTYSAAVLVIGAGCDPYVVTCAIRAVEGNAPIPIILVSTASNPRLHRSLGDAYGATRSINFRDIYGLADLIILPHAPIQLRLLLADDRDDIAAPMAAHLSPRFEVVRVSNGIEARTQAEKAGHWDLIVLDNMMPRMTGMDVLAQIRKTDLETPIVLHSAFFDQRLVCEAIASGANDAWAKNLKAAVVRTRVDRVISRSLQVMQQSVYENT